MAAISNLSFTLNAWSNIFSHLILNTSLNTQLDWTRKLGFGRTTLQDLISLVRCPHFQLDLLIITALSDVLVSIKHWTEMLFWITSLQSTWMLEMVLLLFLIFRNRLFVLLVVVMRSFTLKLVFGIIVLDTNEMLPRLCLLCTVEVHPLLNGPDDFYLSVDWSVSWFYLFYWHGLWTTRFWELMAHTRDVFLLFLEHFFLDFTVYFFLCDFCDILNSFAIVCC